MTPSAAAAIDNYLDYANAVFQVQMPDYFYAAWVYSRLVPANKVHLDDLLPETTPDCCPVNIGSTKRRLITQAFFDKDLKATFNKIVGPVQNGVGTQAGISIMAFRMTAALDAAPEFGVIQGDLKNGYNEVSRKNIMRALQEAEKFGDMLMFSHALLCHSSYFGMGSGLHLTNAPFRIDEGVQQGAVESSWFFAIPCNKGFQNLNNKLAPFGGGVMAIIDDNYIISPKEEIFEACKGFAADLTDIGLQLQPVKSACYIGEEFCNTEWDSLRGDIPNGLITDVHGNVTFGLAVCNVPVGSKAFVKAYLAWKGTHILRGFNVIQHLLGPGRWPHPDIPARQMLWILALACLQFTGDYWIRHVCPDYNRGC
jgi:hypothetical protein